MIEASPCEYTLGDVVHKAGGLDSIRAQAVPIAEANFPVSVLSSEATFFCRFGGNPMPKGTALLLLLLGVTFFMALFVARRRVQQRVALLGTLVSLTWQSMWMSLASVASSMHVTSPSQTRAPVPLGCAVALDPV